MTIAFYWISKGSTRSDNIVQKFPILACQWLIAIFLISVALAFLSSFSWPFGWAFFSHLAFSKVFFIHAFVASVTLP